MNTHLGVPGGIHTSSSFDNLSLANPRLQEIRAQRRRGSEPFMEPYRSAQNSPMVRRSRQTLSRQISKSAQNSPLMPRAGRLPPTHPSSAADLLAIPDYLPPSAPRSRRGSEQLGPDWRGSDWRGSERRPRVGSRDQLAPVKDKQQRHHENNNGNSGNSDKDATAANSKPEVTQSAANDVAKSKDDRDADVEMGSPPPTSPVTSPTSPTPLTMRRSSATAAKKCGARSVLKYFCVLVFVAGIGAIIYFIVIQVLKSKSDANSPTTTAPS